jgi:hypothetical protein
MPDEDDSFQCRHGGNIAVADPTHESTRAKSHVVPQC